MSWPTASWSSSVLVRPPRLSEPAISQFVPAEVNPVGVSTSTLVSLEFRSKYRPTAATPKTTTRAARMASMRFGRTHRRQPRGPRGPCVRGGPPSPGQLRGGGWPGHALPRGMACVGS